MNKLITERHKKAMAAFILGMVLSFPRRGVVESVTQFAERKRILTGGTSATSGPYRYYRTPYLRRPADCLSDFSKFTEVNVMKATQTGGTDGILMNHQLYCMEYGIGPIHYMTADEDLAKDHMEQRWDPMIKAADMQDLITPAVEKKGNKSTGDKNLMKSFKGTFLRATGSRSENKSKSLPGRILHLDEVDGYPDALRDGGDPTMKLIRRADSYRNLKKICRVSTPKLKAKSRIEPAFKEGTMEYYNVPCPKCGMLQPLKWSQIKWEKDEDKNIALEFDSEGNILNDPVWHECANEECGYRMKCHEKVNFMKEEGHGGRARWIATKKPDRPGVVSFHINALYGFRTWIDIVLEWERINGDQKLLQEFVNDTLGETYEEEIDKPDEHYLMARAETDWQRGEISEKVKTLHLGADVQGDRLEYAIVGFSDFKEAWIVDYGVLRGNTGYENDDCYNRLEAVILEDYEKMNGVRINISVALIDSPFENAAVLAFCGRFPYNSRGITGVFPSIGKQNIDKIVKEFASPIGTPYIHIDDQKLKHEIYGNLKKKQPVSGGRYPYGYIHYHSDYNEDFFKQLTAEDVIETVDKKGISTYLIANPHQRRNEVLDCVKECYGGLYWRYFKYFELWNKKRRDRKKAEIPKNWEMFWLSFGKEEES